MGADFVYSICRIPYTGDGDVLFSGKTVANVIKQRFLKIDREEVLSNLEDCGIYCDGEDFESFVSEKAEEISDFLESGWNFRDTATLVLEGRHYYITGGMSWGDTPTESYDVIALIEALGITEEPITDRELELA